MIPDDYQKICHGKWHHTEPQQGFEKKTTAHFPQIEGKDNSDLSDYHKWLISKGVNFPDTNKVEENQQIFAVFQNNLPEELTQASFISELTSKEILDIKEDTKPFLLLANFYEPHSPFTGPLNGLYDPEKIPVGRPWRIDDPGSRCGVHPIHCQQAASSPILRRGTATLGRP